MLWDLVRDFFVLHIFGGTLSNGDGIYGYLGYLLNSDIDSVEATTGSLYLNVGSMIESGSDFYGEYMTIGDYLSTLATIISMIIIVVCCAKLVLYIFNTMRRIIS